MIFFTFAKIEAARERESYLSVAKGEVAKLPGVNNIYLAFGTKDLVIIHESHDIKVAMDTAFKIRSIPGVIDTETMVCLEISEVVSAFK